MNADIRTDGTLRPAVTLQGPNFLVNEALGRLSGSNLFHSFAVFDIGVGQSATFVTTTPGLANVISRVTGGTASQINGALRLSSANAAPNFFFINPAGVVFGRGASIDMPAAFHVSTANYVKFPDGSFHVDPQAVSTLSAATPDAFGFLGTTRAQVVIRDGARLSTVGANPVGIVAGGVLIDNGTVATQGGDIRVAALAQAATEVALTGPLPPSQGTVVIQNGGLLQAETPFSSGGGSVMVSARDIVIDGANGEETGIITFTDPGRRGAAGAIDLAATGTLALRGGGTVVSYTSSAHDAGPIKVNAGSLLIDGGENGAATGIATIAFGGTGNAGRATIAVAGDLILQHGGQITSSTAAAGRAGIVRVSADRILIDGAGSTVQTGIFSQARERSRGDAGSIEIAATRGIVVVNAGTISTTTYSVGDAGSIRIDAGALALGAGGNVISEAQAGSGNAGNIDIAVTGLVDLRSGGVVSTNTFTAGSAGSVSVRGGSITIDGDGSPAATGILSISASAANAGNVTVSAAGNIELSRTGIISSSTLGSGNAGNVGVATPEYLAVRSAALITSSSIASDGGPRDPGNAGNVEVRAGTLVVDGAGSNISAVASPGSTGQTGSVDVAAANGATLSNGGFLSIQNFATVADPGKLTPTTLHLSAPAIQLDGGQITAASTGNVSASEIEVDFSDRLTLNRATVSTSANAGNGGGITLRGGDLFVVRDSHLTTSVLGATGNGGDIRIHATAMILDTGFIQANTAARTAKGGDVAIDAEELVPNGATLFVGGSTPQPFAPGVFGFNVIQAAAPDGVSGNIAISTPALDIAGSLSTLPVKFFDAGGPARSPCAVIGGSSLSAVGRGGLPPPAGSMLRTDAVPREAAPNVADSPAVAAPIADLDSVAAHRRAAAPCYM